MDFYLIKFYTAEPKPPEIYCCRDETTLFLERLKDLFSKKAKFVIYTLNNRDNVVADFS